MWQQGLTAALNFTAAAMLLSLVVSATFALAGWRRRQDLRQRQGRPQATDRFALGHSPFAGGMLDVAIEAAFVLRTTMLENGVRIA